ncbi:MAG: acyl-CoA thioesterase [Chloroflexales bacterium]|nr:acyl-CoA thioesterase [Chloroflexales bacterium]
MQNTPHSLTSYPFVYWTQVRFRDLDALGHVNNAVYLTYFESARLEYYTELTGLRLEQVDIILAEMTVSYHAPAIYNDWLAIGVRVGTIGRKSFTMEYLAVRSGDEQVIASGRSVLVAYNYADGHSISVTDQFRAQVTAHQG